MIRHCLQSLDQKISCGHFSCAASWALRLVLFITIATSATWAYAGTPPANFPQGRKVEVREGAALRNVAEAFKQDDLIRSSLFFEGFVRFLGGDTGIRAGTYFFEEQVSVFEIAKRLTRGIFGLTPVRITIPEGATVREIAAILKQKFPDISKTKFLALATDSEGYLFPDTYFFLDGTPVEQIIAEMKKNFRIQIRPYESAIADSDLKLNELITLASLLEKEARKPDERREISGIVRNRLEKDMPLQMDATFRYVLGKGSFDLTLKDLRNDSPYNTYTNKGLPPGPIANPGLDSIIAALEPKQTPYLYYLHDLNGRVRYAKTFAEHRQNKFAYLP